MIYVLDTNTCIYYLNGTSKSVLQEIQSRTLEELAVTSITVAELFYGAHHSGRRTENLEALEDFLEELQILPFGREAAQDFGRLKEALRREGKALGPYDLLIAATVLSRDCTLITHDTKAFSQIKDLLLEDWVR